MGWRESGGKGIGAGEGGDSGAGQPAIRRGKGWAGLAWACL